MWLLYSGILIAAKALLDEIMTLPRVKFVTGWLETFVDVTGYDKIIKAVMETAKDIRETA